MKKLTKIISLALVMILSVGVFAACVTTEGSQTLSTEVYEGDVIYVGNTAGTTGNLAKIVKI